MGIVSGVQKSLQYMTEVLIDGRDAQGNSLQLGSKFFVESGTCDQTTSDKVCAGKKRYLYFDTVPSAVQPCADHSQPIDPKGKTTFPQGLLSGIVNDAVHLNPFELGASLVGKGSRVNSTCVQRTLPVGKVVPYGGAELSFETRCTAPEMPVVCGGSGDSSTACVPYEAAPAFKPLHDTVRKVIPETAVLANPAATPGKYPARAASVPVNKNDGLWRRLCTRTEEAFGMALNNPQVLPNPSGNQVELETTARCLAKSFECKVSSEYGRGWRCYCWMAIHGLRNMPAASALNHSRGCKSITDAKQCANGKVSQMYCSWDPESGCHAIVPTVQIYWVGYINSETLDIMLDPELFNAGVGNPPGPFSDMPTTQFARVGGGGDTFADYQGPSDGPREGSRVRHDAVPVNVAPSQTSSTRHALWLLGILVGIAVLLGLVSWWICRGVTPRRGRHRN